MFIYAKLVFKSYMPKQLEKGMWFVSKQQDLVYGKVYEYLKLHELTHIPQDMNSYISINGAPVEPYIVQPMSNPDESEEILATPDQIGWWDRDTDDEDGDLEDLSVKIINDYIYGENGENGSIALQVWESQDEDGLINRSLVLFHDKVTIADYYSVEDDYDDDYDDDIDEDDLTDADHETE